MDLTLSTLELVCISLGAGSAFIFDSFFMLSLKDHKLRKIEVKMLYRISLLGVTSAILALCFYIALVITELQASTDLSIGFATAKLIIFGVALSAGLALRSIHLPALVRHQTDYLHLSERMVEHQNPLIATAAHSTVAWIFVVFLTAVDSRGLVSTLNVTFIPIILTYIAIAYLASHVAVFVKNRILTR